MTTRPQNSSPESSNCSKPQRHACGRCRIINSAADFEHGEIGPDLFRAACNMGLEGLVSKRRDRPYRAGRSPDWVKVKNSQHPSVQRIKEAFA